MPNRRYSRRRSTNNSCSPIRSSRRTRRRDRAASSQYRPTVVSSDVALRGVQSRLFGGVLTALLTLGCIVFVLTASSITMGVTFAFTIGTYSLAASIALLMSARQEEVIHQFTHCSHKELENQDPDQQLLSDNLLSDETAFSSFASKPDSFHQHKKPHTSEHHATDGRL